MKKAFTLIELVMAIVIAGIVLVPLLSIFVTSPIKNPRLDAFNMAIQLANGKMETVSSRSFNAISSEAVAAFGGNFGDFSSQVVVNYVSSTEPNVSVDPTVTNYKKIQVLVTTTNLPGASIDLTTLITDVSNP